MNGGTTILQDEMKNTGLLLQPLTIKNITLHNRLVMSPMECRKTDERGLVSPEMLDYYDARTKGGVFGLVITEHHFVSPEGRASAKQLAVTSDDVIDSNRQLVDLVHENGSKIFMQLGHAGMVAKPLDGEGIPLGPTGGDIPSPLGGTLHVTQASVDDIHRITNAFTEGAVRAKEAGFDGVDIHAAHGYLLSEFFSPITNHRQDKYGGSLENRLRFDLEVLRAIRSAVGDDFIISIRFGVDYNEFGNTLDVVEHTSKLLVEAGADVLNVSMGMGGGDRMKLTDEDVFSDAAAIAKKSVDVPVITVGNIHTAAGAESLLKDGKADLTAIGRPVFRDAEFARNLIANA